MTEQNPTVHDLVAQLGDVERLDAVVGVVTKLADTIYGGRPELRQAMQGDGTLGSPIHPALVHLPIGGAVTAAVLDLVGLKAASGVATAATLAGAAPAALAGLADFESFQGKRIRRIAAAHAVVAAKGSALAAVSLAARASGNHGLARLALWGCCASYGAAGAIGGYLSMHAGDSDAAAADDSSSPHANPPHASTQAPATADEPPYS